MEEKKEKKKGFFASLFAPKPCKCSCGVQIEEVAEDENPIKDLNLLLWLKSFSNIPF